MKQKKFKRGIAMIELIFALVIMGIVLLSTPMLIQQSTQSGFVAIQQEAIAATASHTQLLLAKYWDEIDANNSLGIAPIVIPNSPINLSFNNAGMKNIVGRTTAIAGLPIPASSIGRDFNETNISNNKVYVERLDDIDDYNGLPLHLTIFKNETTTTSAGDYIDQNITITTAVTFADDRTDTPIGGDIVNADNHIFDSNVSPNDSNIKFVKVNLTSNNTNVAELNKSITLNAFSCNIGTFSLEGIQY
ncbi:MAG: hypothetical protein KAU90_02135 [Sulfurovaceae bacterium]|nr:hypothetical protein [Sulfurovaceae bacterium]